MNPIRHLLPIAGAACFLFGFAGPSILRASDHADSPTTATDQGADIGDQYAFLDPNDNSKVVLIMTVRGFIVPGENNNFALFDHAVRYTFCIENTGDAISDMFIDVRFSERKIVPPATTPAQEATISFRGAVPNGFGGTNGTFTAPVDMDSISETVAPPQLVTALSNNSNPSPGIDFFAGETADPFFFDGPAFSYFVNAVKAGDPNAAQQLTRGRNTFAGYNIMAMALRIPASLLLSSKPGAPTVIGVNSLTARQQDRPVNGQEVGSGPWMTVDRLGIPAVNVELIPYNDKDAFNAASTYEDAQGKFFNDIVGTLTALGTTGTYLTTLESVLGLPSHAPPVKPSEVGTGDFLRLQTNSSIAPNNGLGVPGTGSNGNGFPNGRRLGDDVVATIIYLVSNGTITTGDNVPKSNRTLGSEFPFLATPNMPLASGVDPTQN
jgi:hypothetical protein